MNRRDFITTAVSGITMAAATSALASECCADESSVPGKRKESTPASILIKNGTIVPMDGNSRTLENQALLIEGDRISAIGKAEDLLNTHTVDRVIDASGKAVMPGFVNAHTHAADSTILRGLAEDIDPFQYSQLSVPLEEEILTEEDIYSFARLGSVELLKFGNTCAMELGAASQAATAQAFHDSGIRGIIAPDVSDIMEDNDAMRGGGKADPKLKKKRFAEARRLLDKWQRNEESLVNVRIANYMPVLCSPDTLLESKALADEYDVGLNAHAGFGETEYFKSVFGKNQIQYLFDIGYLDKNTSIVHMLLTEKEEVAPFRESGAWMIHCPFEFAKRGYSAPMDMLYEANLNIALGSDWLMFDPFEQMRYAAVLARLNRGGIGSQKAYDFLDMMTNKAAKAVGLGEQVGSLEVGKKADIILVDFHQAHISPMNRHYDLVTNLVYNAHGSDVRAVIVGGKVVVENGEIKTIDEGEAIEDVNRRSERALTKRFSMPDANSLRAYSG